MGYAWAPQITGLVRGEPKPKQRHRSNGKAILMEFCEERASKSPTLDRKRSHLNTYWHYDEGLRSGTAVWDAMCADADAYRSKVTLRDGSTAERGLRKDAVIGWAAIIKPPPEMVAELGMDEKARRKFCEDSFEALCEIEPRIFRKENVKASAYHRDEDNDHVHVAGESKDADGRYCGNLIDANLCIRINQEFPKLMRGMGWEIDDLDMTDWERMKTDEAYRAERTAKRKRQGQTVERYGKQKAEEASKTADRIIERELGEAYNDLKYGFEEMKKRRDALDEREDGIKKLCAETENMKQALEAERAKLCVEKEKAEQAVRKSNNEIQQNEKVLFMQRQEIEDMQDYKAFKTAKAKERAEQEAREAREKARQEAERAVRKECQQPAEEKTGLRRNPQKEENAREDVQNAPETLESKNAIPDTAKTQKPLKNDRRPSVAKPKEYNAFDKDGNLDPATLSLFARLGIKPPNLDDDEDDRNDRGLGE